MVNKEDRFLKWFFIKDKNGNKVRYKRNKAQIHFNENRTGRDYVLKARQIGFTTDINLKKLSKTLYYPNTTSVTIAHRLDKAKTIFRIAKFAWDNLDDRIKEIYQARYDNVRELMFEANESNYFVGIEARSSTVNDLHISEFAFVPDPEKMIAATFEAVPKGGTITLETTGNGMNYAYDFWNESVAGKTGFKPHFYNWTWDDNYIEKPPKDSGWKEHYQQLAKQYGLIGDIQQRLNISDYRFFWYYNKARVLKELVRQEYPTTAEEAFISMSAGVFDLYKVNQLSVVIPVGKFDGVDIYKEPEPNHKYIIGIDTAEGVENDYTGLEVIDGETLEEVASFRDNTIRPDQIADLSIRLGNKYNQAFIIAERNSSGLTTVLKLQERGYNRVFINRQVDKRTQKVKNEIGWRTSSANRDMMIDDFVELFDEGKFVPISGNVIGQMKTFVRKDNGRREHEEGKHDDNLFALFLCVQGRKYYREPRVFATKPSIF